MDLRELKKAKKREKLLMKQLQQERVNEKCSEWEELNMNQELHPISHYINDREEMIKQMFNVVSERQLMKMLPPGLKGMSVEELQADCLIQLVGMSKKRIMAILEGRELESSSESPSESDLDGTSMEEEPETIVKASKNKKTKKACKRTATIALQDTQKHAVLNSKKVKTKHRVKKEKIEVIVSRESDNDVVDTASIIKDAGVLPEKENVEHKGKTLLEILELEMRAKAIRALLERENQPEEEKQLKNESNKKSESAKNEKIVVTTVEQVVNNVKEGIADKNNDTDLIPSATEKDSEDIVILDEEIIKIDLTSDDETTSKTEETPTKLADIVTEKEPNLNSQPTVVLQTDNPGSSTEVSCERISSTVEKSSTSPEKSNWAQRWLDSSKVKKVVSTSKMCTNIRRKIKKSLMLKTKQVEESQPAVEAEPEIPIQEFSGSTQEYELLKKLVKKKKNDELINQEKSESNTQDGIESQLQENSESNEQEGGNLELQENSESHLEERSDSNPLETSDSQPQDNRESSLQEDLKSQPQDESESPSQEDLDSQTQDKSESNLPENSDSHPQDRKEPNLREDSELQLQEDNDSNLQRVVTSESEVIGESNQENVMMESQEENESPIEEDEEEEGRPQTQENSEMEQTENIQSNSQECSRSSSVYENSESIAEEISETLAKYNSEPIPDVSRESNSHKDMESNLHENSECNSSEVIEADRHGNSETLEKSDTDSPKNNELNVQEHIEQDSLAIGNHSDNSCSSNKDTEPESENCEDDTE